MNILVAHATRHGSTKGIAERIAAGLRTAGLSAEARSVTEVRDPESPANRYPNTELAIEHILQPITTMATNSSTD